MHRDDIPELVSFREIANMKDVSMSSVSSWANDYDDFPTPLQILAIGAVYVKEEIAQWLNEHDNLGRPTRAKLTREQKAAIRERLAGGDLRVSVIAREYEVSRALIYKFAGDLLKEEEAS